MATTGKRTDASREPDGIAGRLRDAEFVHLVAHRNGDALAATGLLCRALDDRNVPYQVSFAETPQSAEDRLTSDATVVSVGLEGVGRALQFDGPMAERAYQAATALDADTDPMLAIAGLVAAGETPSEQLMGDARDAGAKRSPGIGIPTTDLETGLAYSGQIHADFSADESATESYLDDFDRPNDGDDEARRTIASAVAVDVTDTACADRSVAGVSNALAPLSGGPFETTTGYADVLEALARETPGLGCRFVLGHADREIVLETWKQFTAGVHRALDESDLSTDGDLCVASVGGTDPWSVARLASWYRCEKSAVLVRGDRVEGDRTVALATRDGNAVETLAEVLGPERVAGRTDLAVGTAADDDAVVDQLTEGR